MEEVVRELREVWLEIASVQVLQRLGDAAVQLAPERAADFVV
ncbi:MAG: hypothetical protein ACREQ9_26495 [Candidatus Binatia bacterium]